MDVRYVQKQTMPETEVIIIPATKSPKEKKKQGKRRVAAYCRVSTDDEEQLTSYNVQIEHYTEVIESNPDWKLAGIFADEHVIIGTSGENLVKSRGSALVPISFLLRDKPKSFKSLKIINERL